MARSCGHSFYLLLHHGAWVTARKPATTKKAIRTMQQLEIQPKVSGLSIQVHVWVMQWAPHYEFRESLVRPAVRSGIQPSVTTARAIWVRTALQAQSTLRRC